MELNFKIVNAREFIKSLNGSFPLRKFIKGCLFPIKFSFDDDIRVDEDYIRSLGESVETDSDTNIIMAMTVYQKIEIEINLILPWTSNTTENREISCVKNATFYDHTFQAFMSKFFLPPRNKRFLSNMLRRVGKKATKLIESVCNLDLQNMNFINLI